jgi:hypothetical protein
MSPYAKLNPCLTTTFSANAESRKTVISRGGKKEKLPALAITNRRFVANTKSYVFYLTRELKLVAIQMNILRNMN